MSLPTSAIKGVTLGYVTTDVVSVEVKVIINDGSLTNLINP